VENCEGRCLAFVVDVCRLVVQASGAAVEAQLFCSPAKPGDAALKSRTAATKVFGFWSHGAALVNARVTRWIGLAAIPHADQ